jgi:hypothetical protein
LFLRKTINNLNVSLVGPGLDLQCVQNHADEAARRESCTIVSRWKAEVQAKSGAMHGSGQIPQATTAEQTIDSRKGVVGPSTL